MDNFISGSKQAREADTSIEMMLKNLNDLMFYHNPLMALIFEQQEWEKAEETGKGGDMPAPKPKMKVEPADNRVETLRAKQQERKSPKGV